MIQDLSLELKMIYMIGKLELYDYCHCLCSSRIL